jgi:uncharacterized protein
MKFSSEVAAHCHALADLRWLLLSPPLLDARFAPIAELTGEQRMQIDVWLIEQQACPEPLLAWLDAHQPSTEKNWRLGRYAEKLLEFFLRFGPTHQLIVANLPLRRTTPDQQAGRPNHHTTIGEIDYLLTDNLGKRWHWELAVKYFLYRPQADQRSAEAIDFIGPDAAETMDTKLSKLIDRQLRNLPTEPYSQHAWQAAAFTRGWIFYHLESAADQDYEHAGASGILSAQHCFGWWLEHSKVSQIDGVLGQVLRSRSAAPIAYARIIPRARWLAGWQDGCSDAGEVYQLDQTTDCMRLLDRLQDKAVMLGVYDAEHLELSRGFMVPN